MRSARTTISEVEPLDGRWLRLTFADGAVHDVDLGAVLELGGVFAPIRDDRAVFESVRVDAEFGTIEWPGGVDLDPDVLRGTRRRSRGSRCRAASCSRRSRQPRTATRKGAG